MTGASGNIAVRAQNITIDPGQDTAQAHDQQEAHASGVSLTVTGTPLDTARNLRSASKSGNGFQRTQGVSNELAASALDTPSISLSYGRSSQSSSSELSSTTHTGSALRAGGNLSLTATGGAQTDATGHPLDGDIAISGSTLTAGGTVTADANRNVTFQTSTDQYQQSQQSNSSSMSLSAAGASLGDLSRWVNGGPNSGGVSSSPYNAGRSNSDGNSAATQQTATVVTGNSVVVKSHLGDINVIGSGISGTQGVDLVASQGAINVLAGTDSNAHHQDSSSHQLGSLGSNGTGTGFSVGVSNSHSTQDDAAQTQSGIRSQIASQKGDVTLDAKQDVTLHGADVTAGQDVTLIGKNLNLDPGQDATQSSMSQSASQYGVTLALGGVAGNAVATINQSMNQANHANDPRLAALDKAQAALSAYGLSQALSAGQTGSPALIKATVSVGGGSSQSQSLSNTLATDGSTLKAGGTVNLVATGSGAKDANGLATDGDINARGTQISGQNVSLNAARDINLQSAQDTTHESSSNHSSNGSIGIGAGLGGTQNGFTLELGAGGARGTANGDSTTHRNTQIVASDTVALTSGRDTNLRGAEVTGNTVDASVGRDLTIQSPQDTNTYKSNQDSVGFQASICVPPFCYGQTVSASGNAGTQNIKNNFQSVGQQSGIFAGGGGYKVDVGNHTQLDGGVIASTATADKNTLSTQTLGFSNLQNKADYSGSSLGFSGSIALGQSTTDGVNFAPPATQGGNNKPGASNSAGQGPTGFGVAGVSGSASGTTYAAISPGTITVRGDATGQDSTAGLSRDTTHANGAVQNTFDATKVQKDMAIQQMAGQVGMQVAGDVADGMETQAKAKLNSAMQAKKNADSAGDTVGSAQAQADINAATEQVGLWAPDGAGRTGAHAIIAGVGAVMGGGNVAGAIGGTIAGDVAGNAASHALNPGDEKTLGGTLLSNVVSGAAGAVVGGALGGTNGAMSGANGAFSADMFNRQLHDNEKDAIKHLANGNSSEEHKLEAAGCALVHCAAEYLPGSDEYAHYSALETEGAKYTTEQAELKNYNQTYFTAADYGGMVKQVTQSGLFGYSRDDSEADNQSKAAATQIKRVEAVFGLDPSTAKSIAADMGLLGLVAGTIGGKGNVSEEIIAARDVAAGERGIAGANGGTSAQGTANAASYAGLKLDLQTTQAANEVVESLQTTGKLPPNYVDKTQAAQQGWQPGKALNNSVPGGQLGGDVFNNIPPVNGLPQAANRTWQEVDIGLSNTMSRSNQPGTRLLYSNDGLLYITTDHYKTATPIGTWKK